MNTFYFWLLLFCASYVIALAPSATQTSFPAALTASLPTNPISVYQNKTVAAVKAFHTISTTTTETVILTGRTERAVGVTAVVVNDGPAPTVVYNCKNMVDICYNTERTGTRYKQKDGLYLFHYDGSKARKEQRRKFACKSKGKFLKMNGCNGSFESPLDWGITCDEAPPASTFEGGRRARELGASNQVQVRQGRLLSVISGLFSNDGNGDRTSFNEDKRLHQVYFSLNYDSNVPSTDYGTAFAGGAWLSKAATSTGGSVVIDGPRQSSTKRNQNAYTYTTPVRVGRQVAQCTSCSRPTGKASLTADNLLPEVKKPQCKRTSRDRSQEKSSKARRALERAKDIYDQLEFDSSIADNIKDEIQVAVAVAIGAVLAAERLTFDDDSTEEDQGDADAYAQQAFEAASQLAQSSNNGDVQSLQSMVASAAQEASSAASIASTFLAQPTGGGDGGSGGGGNGNGDGGNGGSGNGDGDGGDTSCVPSGSTRQINFGASGVSPICFNSQEVSVSSGSSGRVILKSTDTSDGDYYAGLEPDANTNCNVFRFTPTKSGSTEWIGDCGAGHVIPYFSNSRMVVGVASSKSGVPLLAIAGKDQASLDCFAKSVVNGNFNSGGFFTVGTNPNGCRVVNNASIPDPSTLFNSSAASQ